VPICADTGNQATLVVVDPLDAAGDVDEAVEPFFDDGKVVRIEFPEEALERIECSSLETATYRSYIPSDLVDPPQVNVTMNFETLHAIPFVGQVLTTVTVNFPLRPGEATAANYSGSAYVGAVTRPTLANGELQQIQLRIDFDGVTGPTFTPATLTP
jgi:hypothetical protein